MKSKLLLWLLLLCSGSAWAQNLSVTESFEDIGGNSGEGSRYTSNSFTLATNRYFVRASDPFANFPGNMTGEDGTYYWACEGVRSAASATTPAAGSVPGTVTLAGISNTQNYTNLKITVAVGDPRNSGSPARDSDHLRVQYRYGDPNGTFNTLFEFTGVNAGTISPWTRVAGVGTNVTGTASVLTSTFSDHESTIPAGTGVLYVRIEADYNGTGKELAFDNIRVTGTASTVTKPTIVSNINSTTNPSNGPLTFAEGTTTALTIFPDLTLGNPAMASNPTLSKASVTITPDAGTQDELTYTLPNGITAAVSTSGSSRTITFSGTAILSTYKTLLESVKYKNTEVNNATGGDRTLSFVVEANNVASIPLERIITVTTALNAATAPTRTETFDTDGEGTRYGSNTRTVFFSSSSITRGFLRLTGASGGSASPGSVYGSSTTFTNVQGTGYWFSNGTRNIVAGNIGTLKLAPVNTTGFVNLRFKIKAGAGTGNFASIDFLRFSYSLDGGQSWTVFANYFGNDTNGQGQLRLDGNAANPPLGTALADLDFALPATVTGSAVEFRVETSSDSDEIVFDNIQITGTQQTTVNSIVRASTNPTNAATVNYTVTFGAAVTGLTASNFSLTATGIGGTPTVGTPTQGSGNTWTVPVTTGTGSGTLALNLANDTGLSYDITTTLPFAGETYTIDKTAPTATIARQSPAAANTNATAVTFRVTFGEAVTGVGTGSFTLNTTGTATGTLASATSVGGSTTVYDVIVSSVSGNGTLGIALKGTGSGVTDAAGNAATGVTGPTYTIDNAAPTVTFNSTPPNPSNSASATFTFTGSDGTGSGVASFQASLNGGGYVTVTSPLTYSSLSNGTYTVQVRAIDNAGNVGTPASYTFTVDTTAPTVSAINRQTPAAATTNATSLTFRVTFSENVTGVDATDFTFITTSGSVSSTSKTVTTVTAGSVYDVTVSGVSGNGTVRLDLNASGTGITDAAGNALSGGYNSGQTYTIDQIAPTVTAFTTTAGASGTTTTATPFDFTVTFSEAVTGFSASGISVTNGSVTSGPTAGSGNSYTFTVTPTTAGTATTVRVAPNAALDAAGNGSQTSATYSLTYQPTATVTSISRQTPAATATATTTVGFAVTFSAPVSGVTASNFSLTQTTSGASITSVSPATGPSATYTVVVNTGTGSGTLQLNVANATGITPSVTNTPFSGSSAAYTIVKAFAAAPQLSLRAAGSASGIINDVTAFVDGVQVVQNGTSTVVANALQNGSFENNNLGASDYLYPSTGLVVPNWAFASQSGVARINGSGFVPVASGQGSFVAFLQSASGSSGSTTQNLAVPTGTYQVGLVAVQRGNNGVSDQVVSVFLNDGVNDVFIGSIQPTSYTAYQAFTSAAFTVVAPVLTATVSTTSGSPTSTSPIPFSVSFSQSVGTTFTASDVTVAGGTLTGGSFSGSGAGPYTFTVTPTGAGTVTVSVAAGIANDANNTQNSTSNSVSVQYQLPVTATPVLSTPASGLSNNNTPIFSGTGPANSTITLYLNGNPVSFLNGSGGTFTVQYASPLADGTYTAYITAQSSGSAVSANSNSVTFTIDTGRPTVAISSSAGASGGSTGTTPIPFSVTFSENVNGSFVQGDLSVSGGTVVTGSFSGSGAGPYTFTVTPAGIGSVVSVNVPANVAQDAAGNFNTAATAPYTLRYAPALLATVSTTSGSPTSTSPIPFRVDFSQSVGSTFVASDVTVSGGTVNAASFSGSGAGPYTFTVTPSTTSSTVTVNLAANVAQDAATTGNTASNSVSVQFQAPTIVVAPASLPGGTQGVAYSATFSTSGGSGTYTYALTGAPIPGLTLTGATLSGTPTASGSYTFTITATDNSAVPGPYSGSRSYTVTIAAPVVTSVGWTGTNSTDWFNASNWSPNQVPDATVDAIVPTSPSGGRFPVIAANAAQANARNVSIASGAALSMSANTLIIAANLTNNGSFNGFTGSGGSATGGTVVLGGSAAATIGGTGTARFWNLTVGSNGTQSTLTGGASARQVLTLNGNLTTGQPFTLVSDANGTAMVVNNGSAVVNGNLTVQRYIASDLNPNLGYRHFSAPVSTATVGSLATGSFSPVVNPVYNGSATPTLVVPFPTIYGYDQSRLATTTNNLPAFDKGWFSPSAQSDPLTVGQGYTVNLAANQTFSVTGPQNNGNVPLNFSRNAGTPTDQAGWQLIGNPYPSPLDWSQVQDTERPGLDRAMYVFASNNPSNPYVGTYGFYNNGLGNISPVLPLGQGFFVRVTAGQTAASLTLKNTHRVTTYANPTYHRTTAETRPLVQLSLRGAAAGTASDEAFVYFEAGATAGVDPQYDAVKLPNSTGLNLASFAAGQQLAINGLPTGNATTVTVPLFIGLPATGTYTLNATQVLNFSAGAQPFLRDLQLGTLTDLSVTPTYTFTQNAYNTAPRFELVFGPQSVLSTALAALAPRVAVYPNPATKAVFVELPASLSRTAATAALVDALGRVVRTQTLPAGLVTHTLPLTDVATGVYSLRLQTSAGVVVKKLVVE